MKIKGQDLIDFIKEWPPGEGVYYDDVPFGEREDGVVCEEGENGEDWNPVDPAETYVVENGFLGWQGEGGPPRDFDDDFERVLRKWVKGRTVATLIVEVSKAEKDFAIELLRSRGWKVKS